MCAALLVCTLILISMMVPDSPASEAGTSTFNGKSGVMSQPDNQKPLPSRMLTKGTRLRCVLQTPIDSTKISNGDNFSLILMDAENLDGRIVLPEGTKFQGTLSCFSDPNWPHVKFIACKVENILFIDGQQQILCARILARGGQLYARNGIKAITCDSFSYPECKVRSSGLLGGSGGASSSDLKNFRTVSLPKGFDLPDATTILFARDNKKIDFPSGTEIRLELTKDLLLRQLIETETLP